LPLCRVHFGEKPPAARLMKFSIPAPQRAGFGYVAVSPDGRRIAFLARDTDGIARLWLRSIDSLTAQPLPATEGAFFSFWSPDSRFLAFFDGRRLSTAFTGYGPPAGRRSVSPNWTWRTRRAVITGRRSCRTAGIFSTPS
jgi:hypothetical protein